MEVTITIFRDLAKILQVEKIDKLLLRQNLANLWLESQEKGVQKLVLAVVKDYDRCQNPAVSITTEHGRTLNGNSLVDSSALLKIKYDVTILRILYTYPNADYRSDYTNHAWSIEYDTNVDCFQINLGLSDHYYPYDFRPVTTTNTFHEALEYVIKNHK